MKLVTRSEAQRIDQLAQEEWGLTAELLMEAAAVSTVNCLSRWFESRADELQQKSVVVLAGPGHNGADGLAVARHLSSLGVRDLLILFASPKQSSLYDRQRIRLENLGVRILQNPSVELVEKAVGESDVLVDALFGVGLDRPIEEPWLSWVRAMNRKSASVRVSLDVPSGLNADTGWPMPEAVRADLTCTFGLAKPGFYLQEGPSHTGCLEVLPIGLPRGLLDEEPKTVELYSIKQARKAWPARSDRTHKKRQGHLLVIAGSDGHWGAGLLACQSAYRTGLGYVTWASEITPSLREIALSPEIMTASWGDARVLLEQNKFDAVVFGPGLQSAFAGDVLEKLLEKRSQVRSVLIDAEALRVLAKWPVSIVSTPQKALPSDWVITPHPAEISDLIHRSTQAIEADRLSAASDCFKMWGSVSLLKGYRTVIASSNGLQVIEAGNSALAKAGSGDVLSGIIGGLLAQGLPSLEATCLGAFIHGRVADEWIQSGFSAATLTPSLLIEQLPETIAGLFGGPRLKEKEIS